MSVKMMAKVWETAAVDGSSLLLLLALADFANDDGTCWPSVPALAGKCRLRDRQIQNLLAKLIRTGHVERLRLGSGRTKTTLYKVHCNAPIPDETVQSPARNGAIANAPEPSLTTKDLKDTRPRKPRPPDPLFDAITEVCKVDGKTSGSSIGKVTAALRKAEYTPAEVQMFGRWWWADDLRRKRNLPPTIWQLQERIGIVRAGPLRPKTEFEIELEEAKRVG